MTSAQPDAIGESTAYIVHEVHQPLAAVLLNAEAAVRWLMRDPPDLDAARRSIERVIGNGRRAAGVAGCVRDIVRKAAPTAGASLDLNRIIRDSLDLAILDFSREGILVETELTGSLPWVQADRAQIERLVDNLIANAVDAMRGIDERPRRLRVATRVAADDAVRVEISDTGTGIDPAFLARVFDPHFTTKRDGLGLGLSICSKIVEAHGGRLEAACGRPHGSVFSFALPAGAATAAYAPSRRSA